MILVACGADLRRCWLGWVKTGGGSACTSTLPVDDRSRPLEALGSEDEEGGGVGPEEGKGVDEEGGSSVSKEEGESGGRAGRVRPVE
jgi:hypothetical protein